MAAHLTINEAKYLTSSVDWEQCPAPELPEYAFIGRSNVGKSSLINYLAERKNLALTSSKPGKTKAINHFIINNEWYLVDLPGYGYASISKTEREKWGLFIREYLTHRENLGCTFLLIDACIPPQKKDLEFAGWLGENGVAFAVVFTKTDKDKMNKIQGNIAAFKRELLKSFDRLPQVFETSANKKLGREDIMAFIDELNTRFHTYGTGNEENTGDY